MNRKDFLKTIGMGSLVLAANPAKLVAESKTVNDVLIEIQLTRGGSIKICNNSSYSRYPDNTWVGGRVDGIEYRPSGFLSNGVMNLMRELIDLKDVLIESSNPLKSYNEFNTFDIFDNIDRNKEVDFINISVNGRETISMSVDPMGYKTTCYYC